MNRSRPRSSRPSMPLRDRAAQFTPFAALTGHGAALAEVARLTHERISLSDDDQNALNRTMALIRERIREKPAVEAVYFVPDALKEGGVYETVAGNIRTIDDLEGLLVFVDGQKVPIVDIISLEVESD